MKRAAVCVLCAALLGGCASVTRLDGKPCAPLDGHEPVEAVQVMNTNWKLLSFIPIASGNPERPNACSCRWFENTVTLQNQMAMLEAEAKRAGATRAFDVVTTSCDERLYFFLLKREKIHTSAVLAKPSAGGPSAP